MCCGGRIPDSDNLFRHCVFPIAFKGKTFAEEKLLKLYEQPDGSLLASLAWDRYLPLENLIHAYGCRLAHGINEKKRTQGKLTAKNRHVYCGAYRISAWAIRALPSTDGLEEVSSADVIHHIENGEIAHTDLRIVLETQANNIEGVKTAILDRLWNACCGPLEHVCPYDEDLRDHPKSELQNAPQGPCREQRSLFVASWSKLRFRICSWMLRDQVAKSLLQP